MKQRIRWVIYGLIGVAFGVADFYIETVARQHLRYPLLLFVGLIWAIPSLFAAFYEVRKSNSKKRAIVASMFVWVVGVVAYYVLYAVSLAANETVISFDLADIFLDAALWGVAAVIGGAIVGFLVVTFYRKISKKNLG